jgi:hypothetical protein
MRAIMSTAVDDGIVQRNPCRVRGAGQDRSPERPVLSVGEVVAQVEVMPERYRALVLLAAFGSLRWVPPRSSIGAIRAGFCLPAARSRSLHTLRSRR